MTDPHVAPASPVTPGPSGAVPGVLRWLYSQNPFYIISADLVFLGLRMSFDPSARHFDTGALIAGLCGYTLLLATTGCLLIRYGKVWDDVRSILLLVVMMFLAISVTFDDVLNVSPRLGTLCFLGGLLFSALVSEGLLRGMRLRLPALFRVPYYLILALFFVYPITLSPLRDRPDTPLAFWATAGFSTVAALIFLTLLPAIRRGASYVQGNGSPWRWPMYPWSLFVFLGLGVCGRSFYLCTSLHGIDATRSIFGPYFLIPFGLAVAVLLLEIGKVAQHQATIRTALALPMGLVVLALVGHRSDAIYGSFLHLFESQFGCLPAFATLLAATSFYLVAMARQVPGAWPGLMAALAGLAVVAPDTLGFADLVRPQAVPLGLIALLQMGRAIHDRTGWRSVVAAACLVAAILDLPPVRALDRPVVIGFHLALVAILGIGAVLKDAWGEFLRGLGAVLLLLAAAMPFLGDITREPLFPSGVTPLYSLTLGGIALAYGIWRGGAIYLYVASVSVGIALLMAGSRSYLQWRRNIVGLDRIALGLASFLVAALISVRKAGWRLPPKLREWLGQPPSSAPKPASIDDGLA